MKEAGSKNVILFFPALINTHACPHTHTTQVPVHKGKNRELIPGHPCRKGDVLPLNHKHIVKNMTTINPKNQLEKEEATTFN